MEKTFVLNRSISIYQLKKYIPEIKVKKEKDVIYLICGDDSCFVTPREPNRIEKITFDGSSINILYLLSNRMNIRFVDYDKFQKMNTLYLTNSFFDSDEFYDEQMSEFYKLLYLLKKYK